MRHREKRRGSPTALGVGRSADVPGPTVRRARSLCSVREETASTKVVLWSRVLVLHGIDEGHERFWRRGSDEEVIAPRPAQQFLGTPLFLRFC